MNNDTIVPDTTVTEQIAELLAHIDGVPEGRVWILDPGDPFYKEPTTTVVKRASELVPSVEELRADLEADSEMKRRYRFGDYYDLTGRRLPHEERDDDWWERNRDIVPRPNVGYLRNAVTRFGEGYLEVSHGVWVITGETTVDGEVAFEFTDCRTWREALFAAESEQRRAEIEPFMDAVNAAAPAWAEPVTPGDIYDGESDNEWDVNYTSENRVRSDIGSAYLSQFATLDRTTGKVTLRDKVEPVIYVEDKRTADITAEKVRDLATDLLAFAADIEKHL